MNMMPKTETQSAPAAWGAVLSMTLCVAMLIASEFMPVSLLTPMAQSLGATEGLTGQAISVSGFFAVAASLLVTTSAGHLNRKWVLVAMTTLMLVSLVMIAVAPNFAALMVARALLGITIGGFWSLATAVVMRLVPQDRVPKALAIMYTGQAVAAAFAAPIGSYLGGIIGWRGVFWALAPVVAINLTWQLIALPSLPPRGRLTFGGLIEVIKRRYFQRGIAAVIFTFAGAFSMFTYLRPFLETVTGLNYQILSVFFLVLGLAGFVGTWAGGKFSVNHNMRLQQAVPLIMGLVTVGLLVFGKIALIAAALLAIWGAMNTVLSICWMSWVSQNIDDAPEAAGSLMVAAIQGAILVGGALGGLLFDWFGIEATFAGSVILSLIALLLIGSGHKLLKNS